MVNRLTPSFVAIARVFSLNAISVIIGDRTASLNSCCFSPKISDGQNIIFAFNSIKYNKKTKTHVTDAHVIRTLPQYHQFYTLMLQ